jgi:PBSX family phage portal protein
MTEDTDDTTHVSLSVDVPGNSGAMEKAEETTQLDERRIATDIGRGIVPPYNPDTLAAFQELNETHQACIRTKARYEVAYGFDIVSHPQAEDPDPDGEAYQAVEDFWRGSGSRWQVGPEGTAAATPEEVLELARQDYWGIGWSALEILVEGDGTPIGLAHVPANTVRVRKTETEDGQITSGHGYVQIRQGRRLYFGEAGDRYGDDPMFVDKENGEVADSADELENAPANELIYIPNPSPLSLYYGIPDWVAAMQTMAADQAAKEWNHDVFDHLGIPHYAIKVTGGTLTEDSKDDLRELQQNLKGEPYRTAILEVDEFEQQTALEAEDGSEVDIEFEPLGATTHNDMEFEAFRERNEHEIAKVHNVPPILINVTDTSNRSNSKEQTREFAKNVIEPEQAKFEARLYHILHQTALDVDDWTINFELRGADQPGEEARIARERVGAVQGAATVDEAREAAGWGPMPEDHPVDGDTLVANLGDPETAPDEGDERSVEAQLPPAENKIGEREWGEVKEDLENRAPIEQTQFNSSNLDEGLYDLEEQELFMSFLRDDGESQSSLYAYVDVPQSEWAALNGAMSAGSYHYANIRLEYPYIEITNYHDRLPEGPEPDPEDIPDDIPM